MGIFHYVENPLAVTASSTKTINEVSKPVFMQGSSYKDTYKDGQQHPNISRKNKSGEI